MKSNFEFLRKEPKLKEFYIVAQSVERSYLDNNYAGAFRAMRVIAESVVKSALKYENVPFSNKALLSESLRVFKYHRIASQKIVDDLYQIKGQGNKAAHSLNADYTKLETLTGLEKLYSMLVWFNNHYYSENEHHKDFFEPEDDLYKTAERKLIYAQTGTDQSHIGLEKVGDASVDTFEIDNRPNSNDLREIAGRRVRQYMGTAGVEYELQWAELAYNRKTKQWFRDYDVHEVLKRSGIKQKHFDGSSAREWFKTDVETVKAAIKAVKEGRKSIDITSHVANLQPKIELRPEQKEAIKKTKKAFKKGNKMLWNAKMRFGKTLTALQLIKEQKYQRILIMTHRPVVDVGWFEDFKKIGLPEAGYQYGSKKQGEAINNLINGTSPFVYFVSLQDLRGSEAVGGKAGDKNQDIFTTKWDLIIIDEAHEGTQTELAQRVQQQVVTPNYTKLLELSGTPFNIMDQYEEDQVFTWDYVMEQKAKYNWDQQKPTEPNPYDGLPKVSMYTFEMGKKFKDLAFKGELNRSFNFKEFFRVNKEGKFVHEDKVKQFLDNITTPDETTNYPFSTPEFRARLRHTLWIMPGVKEATALEELLKHHSVFMEYQIVNVVKGDSSEEIEASADDVKRVNDAITTEPARTKTITLTVRKLTTGVTIKPWTGVMFLSNTNSAMQYLQAAFRAQTPYSDPTFGKKTNCYIFDFAPDRALTVMAESTRLNTGAGKRTTDEQRNEMGELLNFLPIIGENTPGQGMKPYEVDTLLAKIKHVYAERAVRKGFDDNSLYSDDLLNLDIEALEKFEKLKAIVGQGNSKNVRTKIDVNNQGLTDEEREKVKEARKKRKKDLTQEEKDAIDKINKLKKQRRKLISILRGVSIRIPLMIYGMEADLDEKVGLEQFIDKVDQKSWDEFMPTGFTKDMFKEFMHYYDNDIFIEAGRIIRQRVKALDSLAPIERIDQLTTILGTFQNPDKETILTPWRVVNLQLGKTIGGYSFFDDKYEYQTVDGKPIHKWVTTDYTSRVFPNDSNTHILEINAKTGLYPLYAAASLFYQKQTQILIEEQRKIGLEEQRILWQQILRENIYVVAKTPMAATIAKRTLTGYLGDDMPANIKYVENIVQDAKENPQEEAKKIKELFSAMKFDVVIGNPPYQESTKGTRSSEQSIYHHFMKLAYELADLSILVTPGRFLFNAGDTPSSFNKKLLNDKHFKVIYYSPKSEAIFPKIDIKGGVAISLYDKKKEFEPIKFFIKFKELRGIYDKIKPLVEESGSLKDIMYPASKFNLNKLYELYPESKHKISSNGRERRLQSNIFKLEAFHDQKQENDFGIYGIENKRWRTTKYINREVIDTDTKNNIERYKVVLPKSNGSGVIGEKLSTPMIGYTYTYIGIGDFDTRFEVEAALKYVKTKFARTALGILKVTQDNTPEKWKYVPLQDFTPNSDIDWTKSIPEIDQQLYAKYKLTEEEISFIETKVQAME
ncbi:Eco57I restriction-modification methylase domain-containing protein [Ligilactobacillus saerimneri]|uniref:Eco57I restriction-modification methylase domain-containing protein n=1 Tax=Ligilactobacillus saerimneri TaxID=228229 RepID=UPI0024B94EEB|nr:Eco57I restriction-modification methylase domain-containing protein [Ligilactobacillus saerimneri]